MSLALVETEASKPSTEIVPYVQANPVAFIQDEALRGRFYAALEQELTDFEPDLATDKSRKAIASFSRKFASTKTAIDDAGKTLNEGLRKQLAVVDDVRREAKAKLDDMRDRARAPLTQWEEEEAERKKKHAEIIGFLQRATVVYEGTTSAEVAERIEKLKGISDTPAFTEAKQNALDALDGALARIKQQEAEREELRALREAKAKADAEEEARKRAEAEKQAAEQHAKEAEERRQREAEEAGQRRERDAKALEERIEREKKAAAERAVAEERRKNEAAEQARLAAEKKAADEQKRREENVRHRTKIEKEAVLALVTKAGLHEANAMNVLQLIRDGAIPHVSLNY